MSVASKDEYIFSRIEIVFGKNVVTKLNGLSWKIRTTDFSQVSRLKNILETEQADVLITNIRCFRHVNPSESCWVLTEEIRSR